MRKLILGTDWWTDCDDAVRLYRRLLASAEGLHAFVVKEKEDAYYKNEINRWIG